MLGSEQLEARYLLASLNFVEAGKTTPCEIYCISVSGHPGDLTEVNLADFLTGPAAILPSGVVASDWKLQPLDTPQTNSTSMVGRLFRPTGSWIQTVDSTGFNAPNFYVAPEIVQASRSPDFGALVVNTLAIEFSATLRNAATGEVAANSIGRLRFLPTEVSTTISKLSFANVVGSNSVGLDVAKLEQRLRWLGYRSSDGNLLAPTDGVFNTDSQDKKLESALRLFQAATQPDGQGDPAATNSIYVTGATNSNTLNWLNAANAPRWVDASQAPWNINFPFNEPFGTHWAAEITSSAHIVAPGDTQMRAHSNGISDAYSDSNASHIEHKAGLDIDFEVNDAALVGTDNLPQMSCSAESTTLTAAELKVISDIQRVRDVAGALFEKVIIGGKEGGKPTYPRIRKALNDCRNIAASNANDHETHFHISLKPPIPLRIDRVPTSQLIIDTFNLGVQSVRQSGKLLEIANYGLGVDLPIIQESVAGLTSAGNRMTEPFQTELQRAASRGSVGGDGEGPGDLDSIVNQLVAVGFQVDYVGLTADSSGDILRATFQKTWAAGRVPASFGFQTGLSYFDDGVDGGFKGDLSIELQPVTLRLTLGVDLTDGQPTFYISENSSLLVGGVEVKGAIATNLGIRNLLNVDVNGQFTGSLSGRLTFVDTDDDNRLRSSQLNDVAAIVHSSLQGSLLFQPNLTAHLPIIGDVKWDGNWNTQFENGRVLQSNSTLNPPRVDVVKALLTNGYKVIAGAFDILGGVNLDSSLPVVGKGLGDILGLPDFITNGSLGKSGFELNVTPQSVLDLINGKTVDLIRFSSRGGDEYRTGFSVPIAAAVVPLGPIPLTVSLSFSTELSAGWKYYIGLGVDTAGFYIDPASFVSANGSIRTGLSASVSVLELVGMNVTAGVGASVSLTANLQDPDPRDGRIYLDELLSVGQNNVGNSMLNTIRLTAMGEAIGFARGIVSFLFWDWEVFNEQFTLASFSGQLGGLSKTPIPNTSSQRISTKRTPMGSGILPDSLLSNRVLTIDTRGERSGESNTVSVTKLASGQTEVAWRGVGRRVYDAGEISSFVYIGNDRDDRLYVGPGFTIPVSAQGNGGNDLIQVESAPSTIEGGDGNDILRGGLSVDQIDGGAGDDQISGGTANDTLRGGTGNDQIEGGDGQDQLFGDDGIDMLSGGFDSDIVDGGTGNDTLYGGAGEDQLDGGIGDDILYGDRGNDVLYGREGEDFLIGGSDSDSLYGGLGNDALFGDRGYADFSVTERDGSDFLFGQAGDDRLYGEGGDDQLIGDDATESGKDVLVGDSGSDKLSGGDNEDQLYGGDDADLLYGGNGNDQLNGGSGADKLFGEAGEDTLQLDFKTGIPSANDELSGGLDRDQIAIVGTVERQVVNGREQVSSDIDDNYRITHLGANEFLAQKLDPTKQNDIVLAEFHFYMDLSNNGDIEQIALQGLGGDDRLSIGSATGQSDIFDGRDFILDGGDGNDTLRGGLGRDTLLGGAGDDKLFGMTNDDRLYGGAGRDELDGGLGNDFLDAGLGDDIVRGGSDRSEVIFGGDGNDYLIAGSGIWGSSISGGDGNDIILGGPGNDVLSGNAGDDLILGGDLSDKIDGNSGNDTLVGELGRDTINGGDGDDTIYAYLNNQIREQLGLAPIIELTSDERLAHIDLLTIQTSELAQTRRSITLIPPAQRTPQQIALLKELSNRITVNDAWKSDLDEFQDSNRDNINGDHGNDSLYGSPFTDSMVGGDGDDSFYAGHHGLDRFADDAIEGDGANGAFIDTIWFDGTEQSDAIRVSYTLSSGDNPRVSIDLTGDQSPDEIVELLSIEAVGIRSLAGDDRITIESGNLSLASVQVDAGSGNDIIDASTFPARTRLRGGSGNDTIRGGLRVNSILGDDGDDTLFGGPDADSIEGGNGNDVIFGGRGANMLYGGPGDDQLWGDDQRDNLLGGGGNDVLNAAGGDDTLYGGPGDDNLQTGTGNDDVVTTDADRPDTSGSLHQRGLVARGITMELSNEVYRLAQIDFRPIVTVDLKNGNFVLIRGSQIEDKWSIDAQVYGVLGHTIGTTLSIASGDGLTYPWPVVQRLDNGTFVLVWTERTSIFGVQLVLQHFDELFLPLSEKSALPRLSFPSMPDVKISGDGRIGVHVDNRIYQFDMDWTEIGEMITVDIGYGALGSFTFDFIPDGGVAVAWNIFDFFSNKTSWAFLQRFDANGLAVGERAMTPYGPFNSSQFTISVLNSDTILLTTSDQSWNDDRTVNTATLYARIIDASFRDIVEPMLLDHDDAYDLRPLSVSSAKLHDNGSYTVVWDKYIQTMSSIGTALTVKASLLPSSRPYSLYSFYIDGLGNYTAVGISNERENAEYWRRSVVVARSDAAPPTIAREKTEQTLQSRSIVFSEAMNATSVIDKANWNLLLNGHQVIHGIVNVEVETDSQSRSVATVHFSTALVPGEYTLVASSAITDLANRQLDGNADGTSGDSFIDTFTVNPSPQAIGKLATLTTDNVGTTEVAMVSTDGGFVLAWTGNGLSGDTDIFVQRFDSSGTAISSKNRVNTVTAGLQMEPAVASDKSGNFVVVWNSRSTSLNGHTVFMRRYLANGTPLDNSPIQVSTVSSLKPTSPRIAISDSGEMLVTWREDTNDDAQASLYLQRYFASGSMLGPKITLATDAISAADVAVSETREFATAWVAFDGTKSSVITRAFSSTGIESWETRIAETSVGTLSAPRVAMNENAEFVVAWYESSALSINYFASLFARPILGKTLSGETMPIDASPSATVSVPSITLDRHGSFAFAWSQANLGNPFQTNIGWYDRSSRILSRLQQTSTQIAAATAGPLVKFLANDGFIVFSSSGLPSNALSFYAQHYTFASPRLLDLKIDPASSTILATFSQEMATSGTGSVLDPNNWLLRLPDGRYLVQDEANLIGGNIRASEEQFGDILSEFDETSGNWLVTIPLKFELTEGNYLVVPRSQLEDASGRRFTQEISFEYVSPNIAPKASIELVRGSENGQASFLANIIFSEPVTGLDVSDFVLTRNDKLVPIVGLAIAASSTRSYQINLTSIILREGIPKDGLYVLKLRSLNAAIADLFGNQLVQDAAGQLLVDSAPGVSQIRFDDGTNGTLRIRRVVIEFDTRVVTDEHAFVLTDSSGQVISVFVQLTNIEDVSHATLSFHGTHVDSSGALLGGDYNLIVVGGRIKNASGTPLAVSTSRSVAAEGEAVASWQNVVNSFDVSGDGLVTAIDALLIINQLNTRELVDSDSRLPVPIPPGFAPPFFDSNGDGLLTPIDALLVINQLNLQAAGEAEITTIDQRLDGELIHPALDSQTYAYCEDEYRRRRT